MSATLSEPGSEHTPLLHRSDTNMGKTGKNKGKGGRAGSAGNKAYSQVSTVIVDHEGIDGGTAPPNHASPIDAPPLVIGVSPRRYWVLFLFMVVSAQQGLNWITFASASTYAEDLYGWDSDTINLFTAYGPLVFLPSNLVAPALVRRFGLRACVTISAVLTCISCVIRALTVDPQYATPLAHTSAILNALGSPLVLSTPAVLSSMWFPMDSRPTATAFGTVSNSAGYGLAFLFSQTVHSTRDLRDLLYGEAIGSGLVLLCALIDHFFAAQPALAPSYSAGSQRQAVVEHTEHDGPGGMVSTGINAEVGYHDDTSSTSQGSPAVGLWKQTMALLCSPSFWLLGATSGLSGGMYNGWSGMLGVFLPDLGFSQSFAAWMGFATVVGGILGGVLIGRLAEVYRRFKLLLLLIFGSALVAFAAFTVVSNRMVGNVPSAAVLAPAAFLGGALISASAPIFIEATVESCYPITEIVVNTGLNFFFNGAAAAFLIIGSHITPHVLHWSMTAVCALSILLVALYRESHGRFEADRAARAYTVHSDVQLDPDPGQAV